MPDMRAAGLRSISALGLLAATLAGAPGLTPALAQNYPARQIRLIVPFAAGGPADLLGRILADEMSKRRNRGQGQSRRLHATDGDRRHAGDESIPLQQAV